MSNEKLTKTLKESIIQGMTSGTVANTLILAGAIPTDLQIFYNLGIGAIGATAAVLNAVNMDGKEVIIEHEVDKIQRAIDSIKNVMEKKDKQSLRNYLTAQLNPELYQFTKNIFHEAVEAKSEKMRSYCAACIVWVGEKDFSQGIDFRKLYQTLEILKQLDDLNFEILEAYDIYLQALISQEKILLDEFKNRQQQLLINESYSAREISTSLKKMEFLGLFPNHSNIAVYENPQAKELIIDSISRLTVLGEDSPYNMTSIYKTFNQHIHVLI
ncbi:hypothetical protein V7103_19415 [Neobacillus drentensis]|uniref:hypothetical protein n=1 Tax=Neobacillus drentensis TaxID=220684 RepID=UPI002FFD6403